VPACIASYRACCVVLNPLVTHAGVVNTDALSWNAIGNWTQWYSDVAHEFRDVIVAHFAGHTHKDEKRILLSPDGTAVAVVHVLPSVTTQINRNPSVVHFKYDRSTFEILDYTVYYSNVTRANADGVFTFTPFYSALEYYGLVDLSAASWLRLFEDMQFDASLFDKYIKVDSNCVAFGSHSAFIHALYNAFV
jgi:sphingomyelin phosphodiesterase acid-like 3